MRGCPVVGILLFFWLFGQSQIPLDYLLCSKPKKSGPVFFLKPGRRSSSHWYIIGNVFDMYIMGMVNFTVD